MRFVLSILAAAILIAVIAYAMSGNDPVEQQPSPHAIDQAGESLFESLPVNRLPLALVSEAGSFSHDGRTCDVCSGGKKSL
ncbi:hypothetical protein C241_17288 [Bradyrhizobium lupini HPC(L)]|uniref:Uncharacterized protein n=1 Tax=Bradyrhizobium lupini HPC(L) TaxID=1229491 RepID=A0ABN0HJB8_RHILU|nr:hypothetical protein C241_17288 [Bradyrhizobium lupini HPC(L)]